MLNFVQKLHYIELLLKKGYYCQEMRIIETTSRRHSCSTLQNQKKDFLFCSVLTYSYLCNSNKTPILYIR